MEYDVDKTLDATGLLCPEPVMMLHNEVRDAATGQVIKVIATDPSTQRDIPKFCNFLGHELIGQEEVDKQYLYYIRKG
jgi:tRNA 2-thiouridine synthesizing protein A